MKSLRIFVLALSAFLLPLRALAVCLLPTCVANELYQLSAISLLTALVTNTANGGFDSVSPTVTAAGTNQAGATALTSIYNIVTTASANQGVACPTPVAGTRCTVVNNTANTIKVYPPSGVTVDTLSAATAISLPTKGRILWEADLATHYFTVSQGSNTAVTVTGGLTATPSADGTSALISVSAPIIPSGVAPTVAAGAGDCGTSPSIVGTDSGGRVTVGSSTNGGVCTVTFHTAYTNSPVCVASDNTTSITLQAITTTTTVALTGVVVAADSLSFVCIGF